MDREATGFLASQNEIAIVILSRSNPVSQSNKLYTQFTQIYRYKYRAKGCESAQDTQRSSSQYQGDVFVAEGQRQETGDKGGGKGYLPQSDKRLPLERGQM